MNLCCFAPPSEKKKRKGRNSRAGTRASRPLSMEDMEWGQDGGILTDPSTFSVEEQERRLKKAKEEELRARRTAEIVDSIVRQESMRIVAS